MRNTDLAPGDLIEQIRRETVRNVGIETRARRLAELIRAGTGRRWVGIYGVSEGEVRNLGWSGPAAPAYPNFPITDGLTGTAVLACASVLSNDVANDPRYLTNQDSTGSELIVPCSTATPSSARSTSRTSEPARSRRTIKRYSKTSPTR